MTLAEKGRFCQKCAKNVIDFSQLSDEEIVRIIADQKGEICGRFRENQLSRPLALPVKPSFYKKYVSGKMAAALLLFQLFLTDLKAQKKITHTSQSTPRPAAPETTIKGVLLDFDTQRPIAFRRVYLNNAVTEKINADVTDNKGLFSMKVPASQMEGAFLSFDQSDGDRFIPDEKLPSNGNKTINLLLYQYTAQKMPVTIVKYIRPLTSCGGVNGTVDVVTQNRPITFIEKLKHFFRRKNKS